MRQLQAPAVITFTSDFGLADHYVGTVKGVLLQGCPGAIITDISHQLPPFSILAGAYALSQAAPYFPAGTVHLVVVDPGVGTARKAIAVQARGQFFVAPDNGVLSLVLQSHSYRAVAVAPQRLGLTDISATFHGRDIFAPVAARLAAGALELHELGDPLPELQQLPGLDPVFSGHRWHGKVLSIDHFGNVITNFPAYRHASGSFQAGDQIINRRADTFGQVAPKELFAYRGSSGYWEFGLNQGHAAALCRLAPGDPVIAQGE